MDAELLPNPFAPNWMSDVQFADEHGFVVVTAFEENFLALFLQGFIVGQKI